MPNPTLRRALAAAAITMLTVGLIVLGAVTTRATADNPNPHGPARTSRCVNHTEWHRTPFERLTRGELRHRWGVAGFRDRLIPHGVFYPKCGVPLAKGYVWVRFDHGRATTMEAQRDFDSPPSAWLREG